ncbi:MAG: SDR family oxidoreductase [Rhodoferax sp.]|nr:SDR family oxidoreductase [Rhodoferax sp.]
MQLPVTPSFRLDGRCALVTGGSKGIGLAAAAALQQAGAHVTIVARSATELDGAVQALRAMCASEGQRIQGERLDVTDARAVAAMVMRQAEQQPFDILVNNAGMNRLSALAEMEDANLDAMLDLNVKAAFYVAREFVKALLTAGRGGSIINMSSQMGHVGGPHRTLYCASKHAIEGLTKALAWEVGRQGIRVNSLCPTYIETDLTATMLQNQEFRSFAENGTALGRIGRTEEIMGAVVFLASDASSLTTGSALMVDGGWTAH